MFRPTPSHGMWRWTPIPDLLIAETAPHHSEPAPGQPSPSLAGAIDSRRGAGAELAVLAELTSGAWDLAALDAPEVRRAAGVVERYRDQRVGLADASLVILAAQYATDGLLTLDHRHFRVLRTLAGSPFQLLPADG